MRMIFATAGLILALVVFGKADAAFAAPSTVAQCQADQSACSSRCHRKPRGQQGQCLYLCERRGNRCETIARSQERTEDKRIKSEIDAGIRPPPPRPAPPPPVPKCPFRHSHYDSGSAKCVCDTGFLGATCDQIY